MNPIEDTVFSYDFQRFVLQDLNFRTVECRTEPKKKPFDLASPEKNKKKGSKEDEEKKEKLKKPFT